MGMLHLRIASGCRPHVLRPSPICSRVRVQADRTAVIIRVRKKLKFDRMADRWSIWFNLMEPNRATKGAQTRPAVSTQRSFRPVGSNVHRQWMWLRAPDLRGRGLNVRLACSMQHVGTHMKPGSHRVNYYKLCNSSIVSCITTISNFRGGEWVCTLTQRYRCSAKIMARRECTCTLVASASR